MRNRALFCLLLVIASVAILPATYAQQQGNQPTPQQGNQPTPQQIMQQMQQLRQSHGNVAILIFDGVQVIDYAGPYEVFGGYFNVFTVAETKEPVASAFGALRVIPDYTFDDSPKADILVIPGGGTPMTHPPGLTGPYWASPIPEDPKIIKWVQENAAKAKYVLSVCNGAFVLAKAGLLDGLSATTTYDRIGLLKLAVPSVTVVDDKRWVDNGKIITSGGMMSGIDGALHVMEKYLGKGDAQNVALGMEYRWDSDGDFGRGSLADKYMRFRYTGISAKSLSRQGDRDFWENQWLITKPESSVEVFNLANQTLSENRTFGLPTKAKWTRQEISIPKDVLKSYWKFADEKGRSWTGLASVETVAGDSKKVLLSVKIARDDSEKRIPINKN